MQGAETSLHPGVPASDAATEDTAVVVKVLDTALADAAVVGPVSELKSAPSPISPPDQAAHTEAATGTCEAEGEMRFCWQRWTAAAGGLARMRSAAGFGGSGEGAN